jgi:mono/diheme cytochrome c family protein
MGAGLLLAACSAKDEPPATNTAQPAAVNANAGAPTAPAGAGGGHGGAVHAGPLEGADLAKAQGLYKTNCQTCHLATGTGDPHHKKAGIPNFTNASWQAGEEDQEIFDAIKNGGKEMPAFEEDLSDDEIRLLVHYVREFPTRGAAGGGQKSPGAAADRGSRDGGDKAGADAPSKAPAGAPSKGPAKAPAKTPAPPKPADHSEHGGHPPRR